MTRPENFTKASSISIPQPLSPSRRDHYVADKGEFNPADLSICDSNVAFLLKLNVQKFRDLTPLSPEGTTMWRRGAGVR